MHIDPLSTAAWNALHVGRKRWALCPPEMTREMVKGSKLKLSGEDTEAIDWFTRILPRMKEKYPEMPILECIQRPGDVIFVPQKWWHCVINLDDTIACTQNFVSPANFDKAWRSMRSGRPQLFLRWKKRMEEYFPTFSKRGRELDRFDKAVDRSPSNSSSSSSSSSDASTTEEEDLEEVRKFLRANDKKYIETGFDVERFKQKNFFSPLPPIAQDKE